MSNKTPDKFSLFVPDEEEPERSLPARLEVQDYVPGAPKVRTRLSGGAYDPYSKAGSVGDTARSRRPRVDLRKLSEWIKTTQQVKALREGEDPASTADKPLKP